MGLSGVGRIIEFSFLALAALKTTDFDYRLPPELIAQEAVEPRDHSRLLVLDKRTGRLEHRHFYELSEYLREGDLLVLNDSRVIPARLLGIKEGTGGNAEIMLIRSLGGGLWEALARPARRLKKGSIVRIEKEVQGEGKRAEAGQGVSRGAQPLLTSYIPLSLKGEGDKGPPCGLRLYRRGEVTKEQPRIIVEVLEERQEGLRLVRVTGEEYIEKLGEMPLPPYIHSALANPERYQTIYASAPGSVAAPTAGLHFTRELMEKLEEKGIVLEYITLHVGLDSFRAVKEEEPDKHALHKEYAIVGERAAQAINDTRKRGGRIICVGTTVVRALEQAALSSDLPLKPFSGWCSLLILPGYTFQLLEGLITNFHSPRSTQLMLISAFAGREKVLAAYEEAKSLRYRFLSLGDCMLIM